MVCRRYVFRFVRDIRRLRADTLSASIDCDAAVVPRSVEVTPIEHAGRAIFTAYSWETNPKQRNSMFTYHSG